MHQNLILLPLSLWVTSVSAFYPFVPENLRREARGGARLRADRTEAGSNSRTARGDGSIAFPLSRKAATDVSLLYAVPFMRNADNVSSM